MTSTLKGCTGFLLWIGSLMVAFPFSMNASDSLSGESSRLILRSEQKIEDTWNLNILFPGIKEWNEALQKEETIDYDQLVSQYKSSEKLSSLELRALLDMSDDLERSLGKLYTFAELFYVQDLTNNEALEAIQKVTTRLHDFLHAMSWIPTKILSHEMKEIEGFVKAPELQHYKVLINELLRLKSHTLPDEQESLLCLSEKATSSVSSAYESLTNADFVFPDIEDSLGKKYYLSYGSMLSYLRSDDRVLRKNACETFVKVYKNHENTLAQLLYGEIQGHVFHAKARKYSSCLEAALNPFDIPTSVYRGLVENVRKHVDLLHRYVSLIKKYEHVEKVYLYDLMPHTRGKTIKYSYDEAVMLVLEACKPLGPSYVERLKTGLTVDRWVDRYENAHKQSGAFSGGCYDSPPYMKMNYGGTLNDVSILAHEAGHSMHTELSHTQPYSMSKYPIFVAEVASTFHEDLLSHLLLQKSQNDRNLKLTIVQEKLNNMRATLFNQTLYAEFELFIHECVEQGQPVTAKLLREKFQELYAYYYGKDFESDDLIAMYWAQVPHFYYNFYVYQYATGICAAQALSEKVLQGGEKERDAYLSFLRAGGSKNAIDLLKQAGVDMTTSEPIDRALQKFNELLDTFESLIDSDYE